ELGHATGVFAPGLKLPPGRLNQVRHHALLAHGLAVQAIRARSRAGTQTGPAENVSVCVPVIETPEHIAAAELTTRQLNAPYLTAIMERRYRESFLAAAGADAPKVAAEDMNAISTPVDFVGAQRGQGLEPERHLHHRERLLGDRRAGRRRPRLRHRPHH